MRSVVASMAAAVVLVMTLSGCATFAALLSIGPSRQGEADEFAEWLRAQDGIASAELEYVPATAAMEDAVRGTVALADGTALAPRLDEIRVAYVEALPDARDLQLEVDAGLPFGLVVELGEDGPSVDTTEVALAQGATVLALAAETRIRIGSDDGVHVGARIGAADPAAVLAAQSAILPVLDAEVVTGLSVVGGEGAVVMPGEASFGRSRASITVDGAGRACLEQAVAATLEFVAAEPDTWIDFFVFDLCRANLHVAADGPVPPERLAEVEPTALRWYAAMAAASPGANSEVWVGTERIEAP